MNWEVKARIASQWVRRPIRPSKLKRIFCSFIASSPGTSLGCFDWSVRRADWFAMAGNFVKFGFHRYLREIAAALCLRQDDRRLRRGQKPASREGLLLVESRPSVESACC